MYANLGSLALFFASREIIHRCKITLKHYFQFMDIVLALKCANFGTIEPFVTTECVPLALLFQRADDDMSSG